MSGFLFLVAMDLVMRRSVEGHNNGIRWKFTSTLEDIDFADDLAMSASKNKHIQEKVVLYVMFHSHWRFPCVRPGRKAK